MAKKKTGPSEITLTRKKEIDIQLQQHKERKEKSEKERVAFSRLPAKEQEARIRGAGPTGKVATSGPATVEEKPFDKTLVTDFPDQPPKQAELGFAERAGFAFAHPIKSFLLTNPFYDDPNKSIEQVTREFYGQSLGNQIAEVGLATLGYASILTPLAAGLGGAIGGTTAVAKGGTAVITRTATTIGARPVTITAQRAFVGKAATSGVDKIFHAVRPVATRFATNGKSISLTSGFLAKLGLSLGAVFLLKDAIGTYPFAGFIKEEASQTTGIGFFQAQKNNDIQGMEEAIARQEEIVNAAPSILDAIPYLNVQNQLKEYFKSVEVKLESDKRILESKR